MIYFLALIPATMLTVAGYFVAYLSLRSEGAFKTFGRYLSFWSFTLAGLVILAAIFAAAHGHHHGMHEGMCGHAERGFYGPHGMGPPAGAPPSGEPAPGAPAAGGATPPPQ